MNKILKDVIYIANPIVATEELTIGSIKSIILKLILFA